MSFRPETLEGVLIFFPELAHSRVRELFGQYQFLFRITRPNRTRLGSFKGFRNNARPVINVNSDLGKYTFLLVFLHELAHLKVMKHFGHKAKPHGVEWKQYYRDLTQPFVDDQIFPVELAKELKRYFIKTPATFHHDTRLLNVLAACEGSKIIHTVNDIAANSTFTLLSGRQFVKLEKMRTRYKCFCPKTKKYFLIPKSAQVILE
jgi:hypothetical protein